MIIYHRQVHIWRVDKGGSDARNLGVRLWSVPLTTKFTWHRQAAGAVRHGRRPSGVQVVCITNTFEEVYTIMSRAVFPIQAQECRRDVHHAVLTDRTRSGGDTPATCTASITATAVQGGGVIAHILFNLNEPNFASHWQQSEQSIYADPSHSMSDSRQRPRWPAARHVSPANRHGGRHHHNHVW